METPTSAFWERVARAHEKYATGKDKKYQLECAEGARKLAEKARAIAAKKKGAK